MVSQRWIVLGLLVSACNVDSTAKTTGGVTTTEGPCPNGAVVVMSDWLSTQIGLVDLQGNVLSESVLSSGSTKTDGLAFPLSGDVVVPSTHSQSQSVVLLDRYGTNVVSWLDPTTAAVTKQLSVGTGFESNPYDYLELAPTRAYIPRWGENATPGQMPFDAGSDILVIDPTVPAITGSIALPHDGSLPPRPTRMTRIGDIAYVALQRRSLDFATLGAAEIAGIDVKTNTLAFTFALTGLKDCSPPLPSPDGKFAAVVCSGEMDYLGTIKDLDASAVVTLDTSVTPPREIKRYPAAAMLGSALQSEGAFASNSVLLLKTQSTSGGTDNNRLFAFDLSSAQATLLLEAQPDASTGGKGLVYGGLMCSPGCSTTCLMADADQRVLQRIDVTTPTQPQLLAPVAIGADVGLPPIGLGAF